MKLRRTNNTAADLTNSQRVVKTSIVTTETSTLAHMTGSAIYSTALTNDAIALFGLVATLPSAGSVQVMSASVKAIRLQQA